ncbi:MAG: DUF2325 domain-containing protein [Deltaproteobacteria bacterium]|nr:DUF2325 domain-containing protein [Deltaproteobacteria bacterium]
MQALLVGGDYVEPLIGTLKARGFERVHHWDGRKQGDTRKLLPQDVSLVVVLTDYTSHPLLEHLRSQARRRGITVVYSRRSLVEVRQRLDAQELRAA